MLSICTCLTFCCVVQSLQKEDKSSTLSVVGCVHSICSVTTLHLSGCLLFDVVHSNRDTDHCYFCVLHKASTEMVSHALLGYLLFY